MEDSIKEEVCDFSNLYQAMHKCKNNVMWKDSVAGWVKNGLVNTHKLKKQLETGTYKIDKYNIFTIYEPKKREIVSTRMKDRVFQRSLTEHYLYDAVTSSFIIDNCACQNGKGTDFARKRLKIQMQRYFRKHGLEGFVGTCDLKNYFGSTPHDVACAKVTKNIKEDWAKDHAIKIVRSFNQGPDPTVGLGLGSQITQLSQLSVLSDLDHFIKEKLRIKYYVRYMDDFHLIHHDKEYVKYCLVEIERKLSELSLCLNKKKTQVYPLRQGIKFLGFRFCLTETGGIIAMLKKENVSHERRKLKRMRGLVQQGKMSRSQVDDCYQSWKAHASKGDTYKLLLNMDRYYKNLWR